MVRPMAGGAGPPGYWGQLRTAAGNIKMRIFQITDHTNGPCARWRHGWCASLLPALVVGASLAVSATPSRPGSTPRIQFNRDIRPILADNCFTCHGPDRGKRMADLRLDLRDAAIARGVLVP